MDQITAQMTLGGGWGIYYIDEWSGWGKAGTLGLGYLFGSYKDSQPLLIGTIDKATGLINMGSGIYATIEDIIKESNSGGTNWADFTFNHGFGYTAKDTLRLIASGKSNNRYGLSMIAYQNQQANELIADNQSIYFSPSEVFNGLDIAGRFATELKLFYLTMPADLAATMTKPIAATISHVDDIKFADDIPSYAKMNKTLTTGDDNRILISHIVPPGFGAARHQILDRADDVIRRYGGVRVDDGFLFTNRRTARQAASELAGDLGIDAQKITKADFRGGPWSWKDSDAIIGRVSKDESVGWRDDVRGHPRFGAGPHVNVWVDEF